MLYLLVSLEVSRVAATDTFHQGRHKHGTSSRKVPVDLNQMGINTAAMASHMETTLNGLIDSLDSTQLHEQLMKSPHMQFLRDLGIDSSPAPNTVGDRVRALEEAEKATNLDDSPLVASSLYALLQLSSRIQDTETLQANQFFELIEDPILNLLGTLKARPSTRACGHARFI
jgi:hypothetical protein